EVSTRMTSSSSEFAAAPWPHISETAFFSAFHFSRLGLDPKSLSFFLLAGLAVCASEAVNRLRVKNRISVICGYDFLNALKAQPRSLSPPHALLRLLPA